MATIVMGLVIGGALGAGAIILVTRAGSGPQKQVDGKPMSYWLQCLDNENATLRSEARVALPQFGADAIVPVVDLLDEPHAQSDAADILSIMGPQAVPPLIDCLRNGTTNQRLGAIKALDRIGAPA